MGLVEIYGAVLPDKKVYKSPFTNKDCVYYHYLVQEYKNQGKHSSWVTVNAGSQSLPFYLQDNTGKVLIDPAFADINVPLDYEGTSGIGKEPSITIKNFLGSKGLRHEGFFSINKRMRYREYFIAPGDKLYILGTAGKNPNIKNILHSTEGIMIQKGTTLYQIHDKKESEVLGSLAWKAYGGIIGGALLSLLCLTIILKYFGLL